MNEISNHQSNIYFLRRNRQHRKATTQDKRKAAAGSFIGVAIPVAMMMKKQGIKNPHKLQYGLTDMLILSGTPILGGVAAGMIGNDKETISAVIIQCMPYVGFPNAIQALKTLKEVL